MKKVIKVLGYIVGLIVVSISAVVIAVSVVAMHEDDDYLN